MVSMDIVNFIGLDDCRERLQETLKKFRDLKVDHHEYTCLKFLILLNPGKNFEFSLHLSCLRYLIQRLLSHAYIWKSIPFIVVLLVFCQTCLDSWIAITWRRARRRWTLHCLTIARDSIRRLLTNLVRFLFGFLKSASWAYVLRNTCTLDTYPEILKTKHYLPKCCTQRENEVFCRTSKKHKEYVQCALGN